MIKPTKRDIVRLRKVIIEGMVRYIKFGGAESRSDPAFNPNFNAGYSQVDVDECGRILDAFLELLETPDQSNDSILKAVEDAVVKLNKLNKRCRGRLIETSQREQICALIIAAAKRAGLVSSIYDITEPWREW